jgi:hypothetical protein
MRSTMNFLWKEEKTMAEKPTSPQVPWVLQNAREQAEYLVAQLGEAKQWLDKRDFARALSAFGALENRVQFVAKTLRWLAREHIWSDASGGLPVIVCIRTKEK